MILASNREGLHFPHQRVWCDWSVNAQEEQEQEVGFAVYAEDHASLERQCSQEQWAFWRPFLCPVQSSSAWGQFSLVYAELLALKWAQDQFPHASWFYVVSGDSVPTKSTRTFVEGPLGKFSVLGFTGAEPLSRLSNGCDLYEHSQWKVLSRVHVRFLIDGLIKSRETLESWKASVVEEKRLWCCVSVPDEWLIGSFLVAQKGQIVDWTRECIMKQVFVEETRRCCHKTVGHAKVLKRSEFRRVYQSACDDPDSFALRKVDAREMV